MRMMTMWKMQNVIAMSLLTIALCCSAKVFAATKYPKVVLPDSVEQQNIKIWSDGRALDGFLFRPKNLKANDKVPGIVTSHGWGGTKETAARYGAMFAEQGFVVVTFSHSAWGQSSGYLIPVQEAENGALRDVSVVKKVVDPIDWMYNIKAAVDYLAGEPNVDANNIGAWGTSFGAGVSLAATAKDPRIKALVTQVGAFPTLVGPPKALAQKRAIDIARGRIAPVPDDLDGFPGLEGAPNLARFLGYNPIADVASIKVPTLLMAAEKENLFKNEEHSKRVYNMLKEAGEVDTRFYLIDDIDHYGIYFGGYKQSSQLALDWFVKYLKS